MPVMAGPFEAAEQERLIPADKKLHPQWVQSLTVRGAREVYRGKELEKIGMPIGGLCAGQLYLGGDGKLWHWDVFNKHIGTGDANYAHPPRPHSPLEQGFAIEVEAGGEKQVHPLDRRGFADISFCGEYPIGFVEYRDPQVADRGVARGLFAVCPARHAGLKPARHRDAVHDQEHRPRAGDRAARRLAGERRRSLHDARRYGPAAEHGRRKPGVLLIKSAMQEEKPEESSRADVVFEDFQKADLRGLDCDRRRLRQGADPQKPDSRLSGRGGQQGAARGQLARLRARATIEEKDSHTGTLTSRQFTIERHFITFWIGGGNQPGKTCINLLVDGKVARTATGHDDNRMRREMFDVRPLQGKSARLEIVDKAKGPWGNIGAGPIVFTDHRPNLGEDHDRGTLALALLETRRDRSGRAGAGRGQAAGGRVRAQRAVTR